MLKVLFVIGLSVALSSVMASEITDTAPTNQLSPTATEASQQPKKSETNQPATENKSPSKQQSSSEKKPSMADYCRKHPC